MKTATFLLLAAFATLAWASPSYFTAEAADNNFEANDYDYPAEEVRDQHYYHSEEEIMAQSICTSLTGLGGWTYAVQRYCSGQTSRQTCSQICANKKLQSQDSQTQKGPWRASAALHVYKNRPSSSVPPSISATPKLGLKVYVYPNVNSVGCGPNYCCCHVA